MFLNLPSFCPSLIYSETWSGSATRDVIVYLPVNAKEGILGD